MAALGPEDYDAFASNGSGFINYHRTFVEPGSQQVRNSSRVGRVVASVKIPQSFEDKGKRKHDNNTQECEQFSWQICSDIEEHIDKLKTRLLTAQNDYKSHLHVYKDIQKSQKKLSDT